MTTRINCDEFCLTRSAHYGYSAHCVCRVRCVCYVGKDRYLKASHPHSPQPQFLAAAQAIQDRFEIESRSMKTIGLIAAMPLERDALLHRIRGWKRISVGSFVGKSFELSGQTFLLVTSGMGVRRASTAARNLVEMHSAQMLISFGIAGAVEADLQVGDVITAEAVCRLNQGIPEPLITLDSWPQAAREAAVQALSRRGARLLIGTAVTTGGSQIKDHLLEKMTRPILEMETAGIAQAAAEKGIPLLSLRAISDGPCAPIPFDLGQIMDENANPKAGRILSAIAHHPKVIFQTWQLIRNARNAADNAAIALIAALSRMTF